MDATTSPPATTPLVVPAVGDAGPGRARAGTPADTHRFEALYARHAAPVLAYAARRADPQTAQDVLAETFLVAWRRRDHVPADALPWLYAVAGKVLHNQRRSVRRQTAVSDRLAAEPVPDAARGDADRGLLRALATLRPLDREALLLTAWEDLDPGRAARAAGCTRATFNVRLHRARRRLARALEAQDTSHAPTSPDSERTA